MKIILDKVCKKYGSNIIFNNFDLEIKENDFIAIYGNSGVGKTTLLNMISYIENINAGTIKYLDDTNKIISKRTIKNKYISYLSQDGFLLLDQSIYYNLNLALLDKKLSVVEKKELMNKYLKDVNLEIDLNVLVNTLSAGMQIRVALVRALMRESPFIICDEPTGNLDKNNCQLIISLLKKLNENDKTIIIATHDEDIKDIAKTIINLVK
ncbi:MAG: ATP-binding cassette domain-containing protein [Bacilli bacterium]|jgi:putative ABC transport system ATP-binding protein|nr:ATP-binding cassette domain-containing protein [Bacilli bacterium]